MFTAVNQLFEPESIFFGALVKSNLMSTLIFLVIAGTDILCFIRGTDRLLRTLKHYIYTLHTGRLHDCDLNRNTNFKSSLESSDGSDVIFVKQAITITRYTMFNTQSNL